MRSHHLAFLIAFVTLITQASASETVAPSLQVSAKSALIMDEKSGCVLFAKDIDAKRFPASTTKIMTTLLLLERTLPGERIFAPANIEEIPESSMHLKPGESVTAQEIAYGLMLRSANDAAVAVALHISGTLPAFAAEMNKRAKEIGCTNTNFVSPNGLHDENHYTTAHDLALIAREAMKNPDFRKIVGTYKRQIARSTNQEDLWMVSKNKFLAWDPSHDGIKTGYTIPAGHCFVGSATRNGFRVITVILAAQDWKADEKAMMDWAFKNYDRKVVYPKGAEIGELKIADAQKDMVKVKIDEPIYYATKKGAKPEISSELTLTEGKTAPIKEGDKIGTAIFKDGKGWKYESPVYALESVDKPAMIPVRGMGWPVFVIGGTLIGGTLLMKKKQSKFYKSSQARGRRA